MTVDTVRRRRDCFRFGSCFYILITRLLGLYTRLRREPQLRLLGRSLTPISTTEELPTNASARVPLTPAHPHKPQSHLGRFHVPQSRLLLLRRHLAHSPPIRLRRKPVLKKLPRLVRLNMNRFGEWQRVEKHYYSSRITLELRGAEGSWERDAGP